MTNIYPTFRYPDARAAIDWLCTAFGFRSTRCTTARTGRWRTPNWRSATASSCSARAGANRIGPPMTPTPSTWRSTDLDAHHDRARAAGAEIIRGPFDTDYGSRDYAARDLAGYVWSFGTYRP